MIEDLPLFTVPEIPKWKNRPSGSLVISTARSYSSHVGHFVGFILFFQVDLPPLKASVKGCVRDTATASSIRPV